LHLNNKGTKPFARKNVLIWSEINKYFREFYLYSHPLFIYSLIALIVNIGGRWLLQTFAGSEQQGFFSLGYSVSALIFLFSGSLTPLFTREFSIAHNNNDFDRMRFLFKKLIPMFYCIVAALGVFVAFNGAQIGILLGGSEFQQAGFVISIMSLYPIHQTYGQLNGSVFYATDQTKLYRNIGIVIKLFGLLLTFYFIGPNSHGGLALGASGIAVSMLIIQFIGVNIQLLYITKFLSISYLKFFLHQCVAIGAFSLLGYLCKWFLGQFIQSNILFLIGNTMIYFLLLCVFVFAFPMIVSMTRTELVNKIKLIIKVNALNKLGLK
jgi:O-antigen/teichoic acid export membrane protein